jgi:hypothetical protein
MNRVYNITVEDVAETTLERGDAFTDYLLSCFSSRMRGNMDLPEIKRSLTAGYEPAVERAEQYITEIESAMPNLPATGQWETTRSPFGAHVNVGDWINQSPAPCKRRVRRSSDVAPIKIVVGSFVSYGISGEDYARRGEAIIAFLLLVQRYRPVELYSSLETIDRQGNNLFGLVQLESKLISLSQVGFVIGHPAFFRFWGMSWLEELNVTYSIPCPRQSISDKRAALGLTDDDIYINSFVYGDPFTKDPVGWIKHELDRILGLEQND